MVVLLFFILGFVPLTIVNAFFSISVMGMTKTETIRSNEQQTEKNINSQNIEILKSTNTIDPDPAKGGGDITIIEDTALLAESGVAGTVLDIEKNKNSDKISLYEVREGDSLSRIAEMYDVSVNTVKWANDLKGAIQPGQQLIILPVSGLKHKVKNGGTIKDLAKIYSADADEIALFNGLAIDVELKAGDEILIPNVDPYINETKDQKGKASGTTTKLAVSAPKTNYVGYYSHPVPGAIVTQSLHGYNGVDFGAGYGTPVRASASGVVITSKEGGWNGGYGNLIVISHSNGTQTLYSHMSSNSVFVGQKVEAGQAIGYIGSTGNSTGNHLHFEVRGAKNPWGACAVGGRCD